MVGWARLELATNGLKGHCSTTELPTRRRKWLRVLHFPLARKTAHPPPLPPLPQKIWRFFGGPLFFKITFAWLRVLHFPLAQKTNSISRLINKKNKFSPKKKVNRTNKPTYQLANKPIWWSYRDSNPGPPDCKSGALAS